MLSHLRPWRKRQSKPRESPEAGFPGLYDAGRTAALSLEVRRLREMAEELGNDRLWLLMRADGHRQVGMDCAAEELDRVARCVITGMARLDRLAATMEIHERREAA